MARPDAAVAEFAALLHHHQVGQLSLPADRRGRLAPVPGAARPAAGPGQAARRPREAVGLRGRDARRAPHRGLQRPASLPPGRRSGHLGRDRRGVPRGQLVLARRGDHRAAARRAGRPRVDGRRHAGAGVPSAARDDARPGRRVVAGLLQAVAQFVAATTPDQAEGVMAALAEAAARLPVDTLGPMVEGQRGGSRPSLAGSSRTSWAAPATARSPGSSRTRCAAGAGRRRAWPTRSAAWRPSRTAARPSSRSPGTALEEPGAAADPALTQAWQQSETLLLAYSDKAFVSDEYHAELERLAERAVDLEQDHTDPAERDRRVARLGGRRGPAAARRGAPRRPDGAPAGRDAVAGPRRPRARPRQRAARRGRLPGRRVPGRGAAIAGRGPPRARIRAAAAETLDSILTPATMRHVASHLDTSDARVVDAAQRFCLAVGTAAVGPLAEVLSREERTRPRST